MIYLIKMILQNQVLLLMLFNKHTPIITSGLVCVCMWVCWPLVRYVSYLGNKLFTSRLILAPIEYGLIVISH